MDDRNAGPAVLAVTASAADTARRAAALTGGAALLRGVDFEDTGATLRGLFAAGRPIIGVCAAGVLIRALAPLVSDKWREPPVVALAEDGSSATPLLGGHRGANALAARLADGFGGVAAVTTAGELRLGVALDAPPAGVRLADPSAAKGVMAALLAGAPAEWRSGPDLDPVVSSWLRDFLERLEAAGRLSQVPTERGGPALIVNGMELRYASQRLALGVGCARGCAPEALRDLVERALAEAAIDPLEIACVVSIDVKADEAALHAVAELLDVPARFFPATTLEAETPRLANPSEVVFAEVGCHGVAEGAALAAAGPEGRLILPKRKSDVATCAVAAAPHAIAPCLGAPRGRLAVVGVGPGSADWRTPEASALIAEADELVGYGLYIDLLGPLAAAKPRADFPLGGEEDRCRYALERAGEGRRVALICSGDAGIYAMGALVMELLARGSDPGGVSAAARRVEIVNAPGVSALQAASARAGALLGHDFCTISLSDLLTPRETIIQRLRAAAAGDFVIAFYNPVSKRRRTLLAEAREILLSHRPADTPVLLAANLGRPGETLTRRTLATLEVDEVDMLTVVLVGSSESRAFETGDRAAGAGGAYLFTPRGYAAKRTDAEQTDQGGGEATG